MSFVRKTLFCVLLAVTPLKTVAQGLEVGVFQSAQLIYAQSEDLPSVEQMQSLRNVRLLLDMIVSQYPGTPLAQQIEAQADIEGLNVAALNVALGLPGPTPIPPPTPIPSPLPVPTVLPTPTSPEAAFVGQWNSDGTICAEITENAEQAFFILRLWFCQTDVTKSAIAPMRAADSGLEGMAQPVFVRNAGPGQIQIDLAAPLFDTFQNQIGPSGPTFPGLFVKEEPVEPVAVPSFLTPAAVDPALSSEATEAALELRRADRREIQRRLKLLGYDPNGVDGVFGPGSRRALGAWQNGNNVAETGYLNDTQLSDLRAQSQQLYEEWRERARASRPRLPEGWWRNAQGQYCRKALLGSTWCQPVPP